MIWLNKILRDVNKYYSLANDYNLVSPFVSLAITEEEKQKLLQKKRDALSGKNDLFNELTKVISDGIADGSIDTAEIDIGELHLIAEVYKEAIKLGEGFPTVYNKLQAFLNANDIIGDSDEEEENKLEDIINKITTDLRQRAGGIQNLKKPDNPESQQKINNIWKIKQEEIAEKLGEDSSAFVQGLSSYDISDNPLLDGGGDDSPAFGSGYTVMPALKSAKEWATSFANEAAMRQDQLDSIALSPIMENHIKKLIEILEQLSKLSEYENKTLKQTLLAPDDMEAKTLLEKIKAAKEPLKKERNSIKSKLRAIDYEERNKELEKELQSPNLPFVKKLLNEQKIALNENIMARDKNKEEEQKLRKQLIGMLEGTSLVIATDRNGKVLKYKDGKKKGQPRLIKQTTGVANVPSKEMLLKLLDNIEKAKAKRIPYVVLDSANRAELLKRNQLDAHIKRFQENIANVKMGKKKLITASIVRQDLVVSENDQLKPYKDNLTKAIMSGDKKKIQLATNKLEDAMIKLAHSLVDFKLINNEAENHPMLKQYNEWAKIYYDYRNELKNLWKTVSENSNVSPEELSSAAKILIEQGNQLVQLNESLHKSWFDSAIETYKIRILPSLREML